MARFIFLLKDDRSVDYLEARDLPDASVAREEARRLAAQMASANVEARAQFGADDSIQVTWSGGNLIEVRLGDAMNG